MLILEGTTHIANGTIFNGDIQTAGKLIVSGIITGNSKIDGELQLSSSGKCRGNVEVHSAAIEGTIEGNVFASHRLELRADARITGTIITPALMIHEGARINGQLHTGKVPHLTVIDNTRATAKKEKEKVANYG